jgi:hypothetical protein
MANPGSSRPINLTADEVPSQIPGVPMNHMGDPLNPENTGPHVEAIQKTIDRMLDEIDEYGKKHNIPNERLVDLASIDPKIMMVFSMSSLRRVCLQNRELAE